MYHFFTAPDNIYNGEVHISGPDVNHIRNVLRMKENEELLVSDGEGSDYHCSVSVITEGEIICSILEKAESGSEPAARFYLFQGLPKADKMEHIIQKSVELGVYEIIPVATKRSIVKYDAKKQKAKQDRWQKIAEGAAKQSHRGIIPEVKQIMSLEEALDYAGTLIPDNDGAPEGMLFIPYENFKDIRQTKELIGAIRPGMNVGIFIGPEGGFEGSEVEAAMAKGARPISLGNRILRTETAPLMLLSVLMFSIEQ